MTNPKNLRDVAEARFAKKEIAAREGAKERAKYEAAANAMRDKTVRLKSQRLAKEAADKQTDLDAKNLPPILKLDASNDI